MNAAQTVRDYLEVFHGSRWFLSIPESLRELLLDAAELKALEENEVIYTRGQEPNGIFCVLKGAIGITGSRPDGKEMLVAHMTPSLWCGEMSLFEDRPRVQGTFAEVASLIAHIREERIKAILNAEPKYWREMGRLISRKLELAMSTIEDMALSPAAARLPRRLLLIANRYGDAVTPERIVRVQQDQLAMMLSLSRQTTNQILNDLEGKGIIRLSYGMIELIDVDGLRQSAGLSKTGKPAAAV